MTNWPFLELRQDRRIRSHFLFLFKTCIFYGTVFVLTLQTYFAARWYFWFSANVSSIEQAFPPLSQYFRFISWSKLLALRCPVSMTEVKLHQLWRITFMIVYLKLFKFQQVGTEFSFERKKLCRLKLHYHYAKLLSIMYIW